MDSEMHAGDSMQGLGFRVKGSIKRETLAQTPHNARLLTIETPGYNKTRNFGIPPCSSHVGNGPQTLNPVFLESRISETLSWV